MSPQPVRIGIVGAGGNARLRHIPGFRALPGVEVLGVVNSTPESTARAAAQFGIPRTYPHWRALLDDRDLDAVLIGTYPNLHAEITCAALEAGKHVLTEARMARDLAEAQQMADTAARLPHLVTQIVPSPIGLVHDAVVREILAAGFLGELRELVVLGADDLFWDYSQPLHWRQDRALSGYNILALGILHETVLRWLPPPVRVFAQAATFEPIRPNPRGPEAVPVTIPDSVQVLTELAGGGRGMYQISGTILFGPGKQIHMYGSRGTIKLETSPEERVLIGRDGDATLHALELPADRRGGWRCEAEFIGAIRGEESVRLTSFRAGLQYMEFVEAVWRSAASRQPVDLPLAPAGR